ncbi:enhancer of polycomb-like-domain-containing protein [Fennellomyces sp. T-0311]|nr:enhancer of polycomb-like-domain-containing protein [Fennellomyces sp. T-0311]
MTNQMVSRFREKKLSVKHPLPIYKESQLPDINDAVNIQRSVGNIETGVEKDEEEEHDLQAALSAAQAAVTTGQKVQTYIPTPDASRVIRDEEYQAVYKKPFKQPNNLIRFSMTVEDVISCQYFMDEIDSAFLDQYNADRQEKMSENDFEDVMYQIDSTVSCQLPHLNLDPSQIPRYTDLLEMLPESFRTNRFDMEPIVEHWRSRRMKRNGNAIIPHLQSEDILKNEIDPYVCFRRRETKPIRKTRRTDQQSLERLRKLRNDMEKARNLLEMVLRREKIRKESLNQEHAVFEKRCEIREYQRVLGIKEEEALMPISKKKRKTAAEAGSSGTTIKIPLSRLRRDTENGDRHDKSPMQLAIEAELTKKREEDLPYEDVTECPYQPFPSSLPTHFFQTLPPAQTVTGNSRRFRKRVGRGGRVFIDRIGFSKPELETDPFQFDPDYEEVDATEEMDEKDDRFLRHRAQLLSDAQLRSLFEIPAQVQARSMPNQRSGSIPQRTAQEPLLVTSSPIKRQNSRQRMTPQQAAVAMTNGMIAANLSAAVTAASNRTTLYNLPTSNNGINGERGK